MLKLNKFFIIVLLVLILFLCVNSVFAADNISQGDNLKSSNNINNVYTNFINDSNSNNLNSDSSNNSIRVNDSKIIYISPNGTGNGLSKDDPSNWSQAENLINNKLRNEVVFTDGTYFIKNIKFKNVGNITLKALNNQKVTIDCQNNSFISFDDNNLTLIGLNLYNLKGLVGIGTFIGDYLNFVNTSYFRGGSISTSKDVTLNNSNFTNSHSNSYGGAVYAKGYFNGSNLNFINVSSNRDGGAIYGNYIFLNNSNFTNTYGNEGGAICAVKSINGSNLNFINSGANTKGGSIWSWGNISLINVNITNSFSILDKYLDVGNIVANNYFIGNNLVIYNTKNHDSGGAINAGIKIYLNNTIITNSTSQRYGGAVYTKDLIGDNLFIYNTKSYDCGGAINAVNATLNNINISNAHTYGTGNLGRGGAINSNNFVIGNNINILNSSSTNTGGAINARYNVFLTNSTIINSSTVNAGGAINTINFTGNNSLISNSSTRIGGGVYALNSNINNLSFINDTGINGGAVFTFNGNIRNSTFISNNAYDGAVVDCNNLTFNSNNLINNTAKTYGLVYSINATINNNTFTNNNALNNILVYVLNNLNTNNISYISKPNSTRVLVDSNNINSTTGLIDLGNGLYGLFTQKTLDQPSEVYLVNDTNWIHNQLTGEDVSAYIKLLVLKYANSNINLQNITYIFTDEDYKNSDNPIVKDVLSLYDSNKKIVYYDNVYYPLENGTFMVINPSFTGGNANYKNIMAFKYRYINIFYNFTVNMTPINKTVLKGNDAVFNITINNTGNDYLYNLSIVEDEFSGLIFDKSIFNSSWTKSINSDGKLVWTYNERLDPNEKVNLLVYFNTNFTGNFINYIIANTDEIKNKTANASVEVLEEDYTVNITNSTVLLYNKTPITINIYNNGSAVLHNISIVSIDPIGLKYDSFIGDNWTYSKVNGKNIWTYHGILNPKDNLKLIIVYKAVKTGNYPILYNISTDEGLNTTINTNVYVYNDFNNKSDNKSSKKLNNNLTNKSNNLGSSNHNINEEINNYNLPKTGLPILLFVIVIIILCIVVIYRKNQN